MEELSINLNWDLAGKDFEPGKYSPDHMIFVNDDISMPSSAAPDYGGNKNSLNPEQGLAASISSCHMMTFLALAAKMRWPVINYKNNFEVSKGEMIKMQDRSHRYCFVANSLSDEVDVKINI